MLALGVYPEISLKDAKKSTMNTKKLAERIHPVQDGKFHDFATGDSGSSIIDLVVFVYDCDLLTAAQRRC
ncbi:MAG: hypothetical protein IJ730_05425 [Alphaproteobacteria bacterium]|nr:hypothetical protein [Alphaproteobacteria bacterium]